MSARQVTAALGGRWHGRCGNAVRPVCQPERRKDQRALSLSDGSDGRLLAKCHKRECEFLAILDALRGLDFTAGDGEAFAPDPAKIARRRPEAEAKQRRNVEMARRLWNEAQPVAGTLAERYLRARAIDGLLPPTLRFHPACWHTPSATRLPAMVAAITTGHELTGLLRTYLAEPGVKAPVDDAKAMLGVCGGGAVRLSDGAGSIVVAEGIETALSVLDGLAGDAPVVLAALSTSGVRTLRLSDLPQRELVIAPDPGRPSEEAAETLAARAHAAGWRVRIIPPPGSGLDWNDVARSRADKKE